MRFSLSISTEQYQSYYRGSAKFVKVQTEASELQQFVLHDGVQGRLACLMLFITFRVYTKAL